MKHPALKYLTPAIAGLCLGLVPNASKAAVLYFDPAGATQVTTGGTYTWDTTSLEWSTSSTLSGSPVAWNSTDAACFVAGAGFTGNITVDVNSAINVAGIFDGNLGPSGCNLTLAGTGSLAFGSGAQAFGAGGSDGNSITMDIPITDGPGGPAAPESEEATVNTIYLYTPNSYTGGFILGSSSNGTGGTGDGGVAFNNSQAFGTGAISSSSSTATREIYTPLAAQTGAINLANNFSLWNGIFEYAGVSTAPVTISGTVALSTAGTTSPIQVQSTKDVGAGVAKLTITGGITGAGNLAKTGPGTLVLAGGTKNTYTGSTTITAGKLYLNDQNEISTSSGINMNGGTLDPGGNSQNFGTLTIGASAGTFSYIDFEAGDFVNLNFADSHTLTWGTGAIDLINYNGGTGTDWNGSGDVINFGSQTGLTQAQLDQIEFNGQGYDAGLDASGNLYQLATPVPEPSSIALGLLGGLGVFLMRRKKA